MEKLKLVETLDNSVKYGTKDYALGAIDLAHSLGMLDDSEYRAWRSFAECENEKVTKT